MNTAPSRAALLERRERLLELEARVQRATLIATLTTWERRRPLAWGAALGTAGVGLLRVPRLRRLLTSSLLSRLKRKRAS